MSPRPVTTERRQDQRKRPLSLVYVELSSANGGMLRDISELGFAMRAMMPLRVGEITPFRFSLDATTEVEGRCKVLWVEDDGRVAGMLFTEAEEKLREQVRGWIMEKEDSSPAVAPVPVSEDSQASTMEELREELRVVAPRPELHLREEMTGAVPPPVLPPVAHMEIAMARAIIHAEPETIAEVKRDALPAMDLSLVTPASEAVPVLESLPPMEPLPVLEELESMPEGAVAAPWMSPSMMLLAVRMMVLLALVAMVVVYHRPVGNAIIWLGQKIAGEETPGAVETPQSQTIPTVPAGATNKESSNSKVAPAPAATAEKAHEEADDVLNRKNVEVPAVKEAPSTLAGKSPTPLAPVPLPTTNRSTTFSTSGGTPGDAGQQEYLSAEAILKNKSTEAGLPEAVRLLWIAVEKGNSNAEVALAELYRVGHGVAKNCDQTRILLTAAARKGSVEAQKHLSEFLAEGCE